MSVVGECSRCGDMVEEGDFCYRLDEKYICEACMHAMAVIAGPEIRERERIPLPIKRTTRLESFIVREIDVEKYLSTHRRQPKTNRNESNTL